MNEANNKKQQARDLFFQTELTQIQIADILNVNRKTIYLWAKEGAWQQAKAAARHMPSLLIGQYYAQLGAINEAIQNRSERPYPTREEAEIQRKLTLTIAQLQKRLGPVERIEEMTLFVDHVMKEDQDLARRIMEQAHKYIHSNLPGDVVTDILTRHKKDRQEDQNFINNYLNKSENTPSPLGEGWGWVTPSGEAQGGVRGINEASQTDKQITPEPAPTAASITNTSDTQMPHSAEQDQETFVDKVHEKRPAPKPFDELTRWYRHLDNKYNISQDPNIIYRRGVYKITPQSPLWGLNRSLF